MRVNCPKCGTPCDVDDTVRGAPPLACARCGFAGTLGDALLTIPDDAEPKRERSSHGRAVVKDEFTDVPEEVLRPRGAGTLPNAPGSGAKPALLFAFVLITICIAIPVLDWLKHDAGMGFAPAGGVATASDGGGADVGVPTGDAGEAFGKAWTVGEGDETYTVEVGLAPWPPARGKVTVVATASPDARGRAFRGTIVFRVAATEESDEPWLDMQSAIEGRFEGERRVDEAGTRFFQLRVKRLSDDEPTELTDFSVEVLAEASGDGTKGSASSGATATAGATATGGARGAKVASERTAGAIAWLVARYAAVLLALLYLALPIYARLVQRIDGEPEIEEMPREQFETLPNAMTSFFDPTLESLKIEDFELVGCYRIEIGEAEHVVALHTHRARRDAAVACAVRAGSPPRLQQTFVELQARFEDGTLVTTTSASVASALPPAPGKTAVTVPGERDVHRLYRVHRGLCERVGPSGGDPDGKVLPAGGEAKAWLAKAIADEHAHGVAAGWLRRVEGGFAPTWKGAFLMTWGAIPPLGLLARSRRAKLTAAAIAGMAP